MNYYFLSFELLMAILFALCFKHAIKEGAQSVLKLLSGFGFGLLLEWATIKQLDAYSYGTFYLMFDTVPLMVGIGWSVILYSSMLFSDATNLKVKYRPILDAVLALNIDLAMDAIAIRLGMWDWGKGFNHDYFGVPYENFWAWFWVIFSFSFFFRLVNQIKRPIKIWLAPVSALVLGVVGVLITNKLIVDIIPKTFDLFATVMLLSFGSLWVLHKKPQVNIKQLDPLTLYVPLAFHLSFFIFGIVSGVLFEHTTLLVVSLLMLMLSLVIHRKQFRLKKHSHRKHRSARA